MPEPSTARRLLEFSRLFAAGDHAAALALVDQLVAENPAGGPLLWQRARTLERLGRHAEARTVVKRVLELRPEFAPAWVMRAELGEERGDYDPEPDLRRAIALDPKLGRARYALAMLLHGDPARHEESRAQMDAALELDPGLHEAFAARGGWSRVAAWTDQAPEGEDDEGVFRTFTGMRIKRAHLDRALADFERAIAVQPLPAYRFARADLLHQLQRYDEALAELDGLLAELAPEDPLRQLAADARRRSENQGAGERDEMAERLVEALEGTPEKERATLRYDQASAVVRSVAQGVRAGSTVPKALANFVPDSAEDMAAVSVAWQILQLAREASPRYVPSDPSGFPAHQRAFEKQATRRLAKLGFVKLGDYDPVHLAATLARRQMLTLYVREDGEATAAAFSMRPKWPGFAGWLAMLVKGSYRTADVVEFETCFSDGTTLSTNNAGALGAFGHGPAYLQDRLPRGTPPARLYEAHAARVKAHGAEHPGASVRRLRTLEEISAHQAETTRARNAYRRSIGFVSDEELRRMMGPRYDQLAGKVREKLALMAEQAEAIAPR